MYIYVYFLQHDDGLQCTLIASTLHSFSVSLKCKNIVSLTIFSPYLSSSDLIIIIVLFYKYVYVSWHVLILMFWAN